MINKYWSNRKKVEWLNDNFKSKSDLNWGRYWYYHVDNPELYERVAYLPQETLNCDGLEINYAKIHKYLERGEEI